MNNKFAPLPGTLGMRLLGATFSLGVGVALGLCLLRPRSPSAQGRAEQAGPVEPTEGTELADELTRLRADRARLAASASQLDHDFRTPIGTVSAALQWMNTTLDEPKAQAEAREVIGRQVSRMLGLTEKLHELARQLGS